MFASFLLYSFKLLQHRFRRGWSFALHRPHSVTGVVDVLDVCNRTDNGRRRSVVVSLLASINTVNRHWAQLLFGWVTASGQVNRLGV